MPSNDRETESDVPVDEREALLSIAHGAVVTSGGVSIQRGLVMGGMMTGVDTALASPAPAVFGSVPEPAAFAVTLLALGLEQRDRLVVHALGTRYRRRLGAYADTIDGPG